MRCVGSMAIVLVVAAVSPSFAQPHNFFETTQDAERRRQAEQYFYEQEQRRRGNLLNVEKPRGLGDAPPAAQPRKPADSYDPNRPRECPPNHYIC